MTDLQDRMKEAVATAAVDQIRDGMVVGLGSGSTAALMIRALGQKLRQGDLQGIVGVTTSFQGEVLAAELGIPLMALNAVTSIDLAIDGADEVDPSFQLIKGGGACHVQEKLVARRADRFVIVVDATKLVERLNLGFLLPVEVLPGATVKLVVAKALPEPTTVPATTTPPTVAPTTPPTTPPTTTVAPTTPTT